MTARVIKKGVGFSHWCAGCNSQHHINVDKPLANGARWTFNGDYDRPTFSPSVNISWGWPDKKSTQGRCHYTITAGKVKFHGDTTHALRGQTVDLPEWPRGREAYEG